MQHNTLSAEKINRTGKCNLFDNKSHMNAFIHNNQAFTSLNVNKWYIVINLKLLI